MNKNSFSNSVFTTRRMEQQWIRMEGVRMFESGFHVDDIAQHFGVSRRAVYQWMAAFSKSGAEGLKAKPGAGRPPKLTDQQMQWIAITVRDQTPNQLKFEFGLWTLRLIGDLIERQFGMRLSLPTLSKVMAQLGFTPQRPLNRAYEQDAALVRRWTSTELPTLRARAKARRAKLMFADEASMRSDYHAGTTWAPQGKTPIVRATGQRVSVNMISAIRSTGELHFMLTQGYTDASVFKTFLEQLMFNAKRPILLVVDGHSIHKAKIVTEYVASTNGMLELHYLPPYSPQLNPDEQVWKNIKERVAKQFPKNKFDLSKMIKDAFEKLKKTPKIVRAFFAHPECGFVK